MPNSKQSAKRVRQDARRRLSNRAKSSALKTAIKRLEAALAAGDKDKIAAAVSVAYKRIDKAAKDRVLHPNTAARRKSLVRRTASKAVAVKA